VGAMCRAKCAARPPAPRLASAGPREPAKKRNADWRGHRRADSASTRDAVENAFGKSTAEQSPFRWRSAVESKRRGFFLERYFSRFSVKNPSRNPNSHPRVALQTFPRACQHHTSPYPPESHASRVLDRPPVALRRRRAAFAPRSKTIARKAVTAGSGRSRAATR
jgi:hypothetical protein